MKKKTVFIILGVALALAAGAFLFTRFYPMSTSPNYKPAAMEQTAASTDKFEALDLSGNKVTNDVFTGHQLTMINVWTTSCSPCLKELPGLAALDTELEGKGFQVIGIVDDLVDADTGEANEAAKELALRICEQTGVKFPTLIPDEALRKGLLNGLGGYPSTFFVDKDGHLVGKNHFGARTEEQWREIIEGLLAETGAQVK